MRMSDATRLFLADRSRRDCTARTLQFYEQQTRYLCDWLAGQGIDDLDAITAELAAGYVDALRSRALSPVTVRKWATAVRTFLLWAFRAGATRADVARHVPVPRARQRLPKALSVDQAQRLLQALTCPRDRAIVCLLLDTGLRLAEVCGLDLGDVDMESGTVLVRRGKGAKQRMVVFSSPARDALSCWLTERGRMRLDHEALFVSRTRERLTDSGTYKVIMRAGRVAGVHVSPHMLRHSFATLYLEAGGEIHDLADLMGHEHIATTMIYNHTAVATLRRKHESASPLGALTRNANHV